jgi:phage terminase small subunit
LAYLSIRNGRPVSTGNKGRKLTGKMNSFIDAYFGEAQFSASKAYQMSGYTSNPKTAAIRATELMTHPLVVAEIQRREGLRQQKTELKAEYLINKLIQIIDCPEEEKTADRLRAIELAGRAITLWKDRQEISGPDGEAIRHEQQVKESVAELTSRISSLAKRNGTDNVVRFPNGSGTS